MSKYEVYRLWERVQKLLRAYARVAIIATDDDLIIVSATYVLPRDDVRMFCDRNTRLPDIEWEFTD